MTALKQTILWIHGDGLSPHSPAFQAYPDAPAVFVWDDALLREWEISLKRIVFIYESLLELPVVIRRGDVVEQVIGYAQENGAAPGNPIRIVTNESASPRFHNICQIIAKRLPSGSRLEVLQNDPFVDYDGHIDLKRFSRYWNTVRRYALR